MKILVADDDAQLQRALRITLASRGYDVVPARDGAEAIDLAATAHPDLVLLDLGMPQVDGIDVIRAIRAWSKVPIVVLSGRTDSGEKVEALDAGADDYVTKPFAMDELLARIRLLAGDLVVDLAAKTRSPIAIVAASASSPATARARARMRASSSSIAKGFVT